MSAYQVYVHPETRRELQRLPGHIRPRVRTAVDGLAIEPRPSTNIALRNVTTPHTGLSLHRLRVDKWRTIYAIDETDKVVDVLAVRQRPPYDYRDLPELIRRLRE